MSSLRYVMGNLLTGLLKTEDISNSLARDRLHHPASPPSSAIALPSSLSPLRSSTPKGSLTAATIADWSDEGRVTIDILPDEALLEIFDFYLGETKWTTSWHILLHVCRRWRLVIFGSPRCLNLQLVCTHKTPVRRTLDIWPPLPIVLRATTAQIWEKITSLRHSNTITAYATSNFGKFRVRYGKMP